MSITYSCPACFKAYDRFEDLDTHRRTTHGRDGHGNLVIDARSPLERRLSALEQQVALLRSEIAALRTALERTRNGEDNSYKIASNALGYCPRCGRTLDNLSAGISAVAGGGPVCTSCLCPGETEIARAKGLS